MSRTSRRLWPLRLKDLEIELRPLRFRDRSLWLKVRSKNRGYLKPWEATSPIDTSPSSSSAATSGLANVGVPSFYEMVLRNNREARATQALSLGIWVENALAGQITLGGISFGALRAAHIGYWIDQDFANKGITTRAVIELTSFAFEELNLHRIEINLRPENEASRRVAEKAGYKYEGARARYLHIDGDWRDHITFVIENPTGFRR